MPDFEKDDHLVPVSTRPVRTWDFMETALVALIADGAFTLAAGVALEVMLAMRGGYGTLSDAEFQALGMQGNWVGAIIIAATPPTLAVLWYAIQMIEREFGEYLALNWPSPREVVRALVVMAILLVIETFVTAKVRAAGPYGDPYLVVEGAAGLLTLLVGGCIVGPILEEFVVRGFMFRGWSQSFLGPVGAIVLTSALWAMNHTQYDWLGRFWVFISGLALGHFRWRTNSTWLAVIAHSAKNMVALVTMGPYV